MDKRGAVTGAVVFSLLLCSLNQALAAGSSYDPSRVQWSRLEFRASKLLVTASSEVEISSQPSTRARRQWLTPNQGTPVEPSGPEVIHVELGSKLLGKTSDLDLWLDPVSGAAFQRTQLETGKKVRHHRHRSLRFTDEGVLSSTYRATEETVDRPYDQWTQSESFETYPLNLPRQEVVGEPSGLFYLLAVAPLEGPGDQALTYVFSKGQVMRVMLAVEEWTEVGVDHLVSGPSLPDEARVKERRRVMRIRLDGQPLVDHDSGVDFEFLGLKGDVEVFLDPERRYPVQISGDIKRAGRGNVRLQRVVLK